MKATITFSEREQAEEFSKSWGRKTLKCHIVSAGNKDVKVTVHKVTNDEKIWIDNYILELNKTLPKK